MSTEFCVLELSPTSWRLRAYIDDAVPLTSHQEFAAKDLLAQAQQVYEALDAHNCQAKPTFVVLASTICLSATIPVSRPQDLRDRKTMLFRLEEHTPWNAEECVADYCSAQGAALMVAAANEVAAFIIELDKLGVEIQAIVPKALLAFADHMRRSNWPSPHVVAFKELDWTDLLLVDAGQPVRWASFPADGKSLRFELMHLATECGCCLPFIAYGISEADSSIEHMVGSHVIGLHSFPNVSHDAMERAAAKSILCGELDPPVDLKRGIFGHRRRRTALRRYSAALELAVTTLLLTSAGAFLYRGHLAGHAADLIAIREVDTFRKVFPNTTVPVGIRGRLESELAKLKGLKGDTTSLPENISVIKVLHALLTALPTERRVRLLEIRIEDGRLYVDGEVREHGDAEVVAQRLRGVGFQVASPRTQRVDDKRISLRIIGTMNSLGTVPSLKTS